VEKAIASFERTLVSANSPFDRYHYGHQQDALSPAARRGLEVFRNPDKGNCGACHGIDNRYPQFPFVEGSGRQGNEDQVCFSRSHSRR
jgi:cytochrome c peroxidase